MNPTGRRNFAKTLGLFGLLSVGVKGYQEVTERIVYKQDELPTKELEAILEKKPMLQLHAVYGTPKPVSSWSQYNIVGWGDEYVEGTEKKVIVTMVPGPDGKLYVKENDAWRKI
jgi:hypothetical protein